MHKIYLTEPEVSVINGADVIVEECGGFPSMENGRLFVGPGNYSTFMKQREIERLTEKRNYDNTQREIERLEGIIEQQKRWNREKNIKTAESKQKVIDRLSKMLVKAIQKVFFWVQTCILKRVKKFSFWVKTDVGKQLF